MARVALDSRVAVGSAVVVTEEGGIYTASLNGKSAQGATDNAARRLLAVLLSKSAQPVAAPKAATSPAPQPSATVPAPATQGNWTDEERAIMAMTAALKQEVNTYTNKKGRVCIGLPRAFSFKAAQRLRFMQHTERAAELGAWCLARNLPNFFEKLGNPSAEQLAMAKKYCKGGAIEVERPVYEAPVSRWVYTSKGEWEWDQTGQLSGYIVGANGEYVRV